MAELIPRARAIVTHLLECAQVIPSKEVHLFNGRYYREHLKEVTKKLIFSEQICFFNLNHGLTCIEKTQNYKLFIDKSMGFDEKITITIYEYRRVAVECIA